MTSVTITTGTTWLVPSDCQKLDTLDLCGGGSGGNGGVYTGTSHGGYGGNAGSKTSSTSVSVTSGSTISITLGAGGAGGFGQSLPSADNAGFAGGTTSILGRNANGGSRPPRGSAAARTGLAGANGPIAGGAGAWHGLGTLYGAGGSNYGGGGGGGDGINDGTGIGYDGGAGAYGVIVVTYTPFPVGNFTYSPSSHDAPGDIQFTDTSTNTPTSWKWEYSPNGSLYTTFSTEQSPLYIFTTPGVYSIRLTVSNAGGSYAVTKASIITINEIAPTAAFSGTPVSGNAPLNVQFTDASAGGPTSWYWKYSLDGSTWDDFALSSNQNPMQTLSVAGTHHIRLTVTNSKGTDDETKADYVTVYGEPTAAMRINPRGITYQTVCPVEVRLYDVSTCYGTTATAWSWSITATGFTTITSALKNPIITLPAVTVPYVIWTVAHAVEDSNHVVSGIVYDYIIEHNEGLL